MLTRRTFLGGAALLLGSAGCGTAEPAAPGSSRVVALGQGADADALIALGIVPVGMSAGYQTDVYPWTAQALGGRPVKLLKTTDGVPIEEIAALEPDLVVATTYYGLDQFRGPLERIATVLGPATTADEETWQKTTLRVGEAVGRAEQARTLVKDTEGVVATTRAAHPAWHGRTFTFGPVIPGQELYTVSTTADASAALLSELGLALAPAVVALPESEIPGRAKVSLENIGVLDADVLLLVHFGGDQVRAEFEQQPLFRQIPAVQRGSSVAVDPTVALALAFPSVLNIPYGVERIAPQLDGALNAR